MPFRHLLLYLLGVAALGACDSRSPAPGGDDRLAYLTADQARTMLAEGETTAEALTRHYLRRIEQHNDALRAVIAVNPSALGQARQRDRERQQGRADGLLHGLPVLLKDNIETAGELPTTAGSLALADNITDRDAAVTRHLRAAGAVILGKANLSEWANFRSERSSSGWSAVGGQARNPYDLNRSPCGSSSGSAAAVAADLTLLAVGTETDGSVVCPASANGVVGIKPSIGLVGRSGIVPISQRQDTAGAMARSVQGAALLLQAMVGPDPADGFMAPEQRLRVDYVSGLDRAGLEGARIGVLRGEAGFHEGVDALFDRAAADLEQAGAVLVDDLSYPETEPGLAGYTDVLLHDFHHTIDRYLAGLPDNAVTVSNLEDLIAFNRQHAEREMKWFRQELFVQAADTPGLDDPEYIDKRERIERTARQGIQALLEEHGLDALIAPTTSAAWSIDRINGDHFLGGSSSYPAIAGYPNITVPMGYLHGLPVGLSWIGPAFAEKRLLALAAAYERATGHRRAPEL